MPEFILSTRAVIRVFFRSRSDTALEVLALRQQLAVLKRKRPRPQSALAIGCFGPCYADAGRGGPNSWIVKPSTVVGWHRTGFRLYWRWRSRGHRGRPKITEEIRGLVRRLAEENPDWGAPKIHGKLLTLGWVVSERSVARYLCRMHGRRNPGRRWRAFLENHREVIVAFDFSPCRQ